ncbi:hypothetical protein RJ639_022039 [Escallonia herrerae]|uniref:Peptidase A1 domain-containing protein n=1 Tax=Escallonia herrerae TaxID=1293975 RepID=A0AA88V656_9ASTE|nr:hypothetical protein RJ639_022039 [Escallonia herrerae]
MPSSSAEISDRPKALVIPVFKDSAKLQYIANIDMRTPISAVSFTIDLGGENVFVDCDKDYLTSTHRPIACPAARCSLAGSHNCINNTCGVIAYNPVIHVATVGYLGSDIISIQSTDGKYLTRYVSQQHFLSVCTPSYLVEGLTNGVQGMAGLGRTRVSLPAQLSAYFRIPRTFAICLSSALAYDGAIFIGNGPYVFSPDVDASTLLTYTPLLVNPIRTYSAYVRGDASWEYFIGVKSIKINERVVPIDTRLLSINATDGYGGTKISTVDPYTVLAPSIYKAVVEAFVKEFKATRVASVAPFGACFSSKGVASSRTGPAVPTIDLVLQSEKVYWRMVGANSMVYVNDSKVMCLALVEAGKYVKTSIVIGSHQIEDNLLQFDLDSSRMGFTSSLLLSQTRCGNFNGRNVPDP